MPKFDREYISRYTGEIYYNLPLSELAKYDSYKGKGYICAATGEVVFSFFEMVKSIIEEYLSTGYIYRWYSYRTLRDYRKEC